MFVAVNIGNSKINTAVFDENKIVYLYSFYTQKNETVDFYKKEFNNISDNFNITGCGIISVVNELDLVIKNACDSVFGINSKILKYNSAEKIKINSTNPETAGMDRVANVYAISDMPLPAIVVDVGTAVTFDILSSDYVFLGGIIMPGLNMQMQALADGTSKLSKIEVNESAVAIGNTTETCILSGVIRGTASAIDGLLEQSIQELGECKTIILTGGQAEFISKYLKHKFTAVNKDLTLLGIKKIYDSRC